MNDKLTHRRGFLGTAAAFLGISIVPRLANAEAPVDESWLQGLNGKHKQFFDVGNIRDGRPLSRVNNFLDAYHEAYGTTDADTNAVVGCHSQALGIVMNDALWSKYEFGKRFSTNDPLTKQPSTRNPLVPKEAGYEWSVDYSVTRLQERGVRFVACLRSIRALAFEIATERSAADGIRQELIAGLLTGVTPVPAMVVAINRAHEAGLSYVFNS